MRSALLLFKARLVANDGRRERGIGGTVFMDDKLIHEHSKLYLDIAVEY